MELLRAVAAKLRLPAPGGDPVAFTEAPQVTITRDSDGTAILADIAATKVEEEGADVYFTVDLSGNDIAQVDQLTAVWTDGSSTYTTYAEVVGGFLTSIAAIRRKLDEKWPSDDDLSAAREMASRSIEDACNVAFRSRYASATVAGTGSTRLLLPRPQLQEVLGITVDGQALDVSAIAVDPVGYLVGATPWTQAELGVKYVHGYRGSEAAHLPVRDLAAHLLAKSPTDWNERATAVSNELGSYSLVTPGVRGAMFPLPSVNAFVEENRYPVIA
jgi:hypothetical protein